MRLHKIRAKKEKEETFPIKRILSTEFKSFCTVQIRIPFVYVLPGKICVCATGKDRVLDSISLYGSGGIEKAKFSEVALGILNMMLPIIVLIHMCLYPSLSILVEEMKMTLFVFALMKNENKYYKIILIL